MTPGAVEALEQGALRLAAVVCECSPGALTLVNVARMARAFGAGGLAQWPDWSPYTMHPLRMALTPCGVEAVFGDGTVDVLAGEALPLASAWYPFGPREYVVDEQGGYVRVALPAEIAIWLAAYDATASAYRDVAAARERGAA